MKLAVSIIILMLFVTCASIKKKSEFYTYEYGNNYKIRISPAPSWVIHHGIEYTKQERKKLQSDLPISIQFNFNTCEKSVQGVRFLPESSDQNLDQETKRKITTTLKNNINFEVLPIRKDETVMCDTTLIFKLWIK